mgnify:CR=1 FL=1
MATKKASARSAYESKFSADQRISALISLVMVLHVLTYKSFFFINPFSAVTPWLAFEQVLSMLGWISLILAPPLLLLYKEKLGRFNLFFLLSWLIWPVAIVLIRVSLLASTGNAFVGYLSTYPIFIFSDIVVPVIYFMMWRRLRSSK